MTPTYQPVVRKSNKKQEVLIAPYFTFTCTQISKYTQFVLNTLPLTKLQFNFFKLNLRLTLRINLSRLKPTFWILHLHHKSTTWSTSHLQNIIFSEYPNRNALYGVKEDGPQLKKEEFCLIIKENESTRKIVRLEFFDKTRRRSEEKENLSVVSGTYYTM